MTMSKEMKKLKSKMKFCKKIIYELGLLNFITETNKYDKIIEEYQNELTELYKRVQELKGENKWLKQNLLY